MLDPLTVAVKESVVLDLGPVDCEGLGGLDADAVYRDTKVSVDVGLAASGGREPALPPKGRPDHHGRLAVDGDFWCVNLQAADHQSKLRVRLEGVGDPVRDPFRGGVRRQDQIDVNRDGGRRGNDWCCCLREEGLGRGRKGGPFDPQEFFSGGIENSNARQRHRLGEHVDDEKFIFHVVLAVVAADNLGLVNRTD